HRLRTGSGCPPDHGGAAQAVCPLRLYHPSDEEGVDCVQAARKPSRGPPGGRDLRLSRVYALLDDIPSGGLGDRNSAHEVRVAAGGVGSLGCALERALPYALAETAGAF